MSIVDVAASGTGSSSGNNSIRVVPRRQATTGRDTPSETSVTGAKRPAVEAVDGEIETGVQVR